MNSTEAAEVARLAAASAEVQKQQQQQQQQQQSSNNHNNNGILDSIIFRTVRPTDIPSCYELEKSSYPDDEAASKSTLQYRQHHAARFFRCAVLSKKKKKGGGSGGSKEKLLAVNNDDDHDANVVGFICSTRCHDFENADAMSVHLPDGPLLAIHSVVVSPEYRRQGIASAMIRNYVSVIRQMNATDPSLAVPIQKIVLLAKKELLTLYVDAGFHVIRKSPVVHGKELWYELEVDLSTSAERGGVPCFIVDAFSDPDQVGAGNPAAVVLLQQPAATTTTTTTTSTAASTTNNTGGEETTKKDGTTAVNSSASDSGSVVSAPGAVTVETKTLYLDDEAQRQWMQLVAKEFNLSETAFVIPRRGMDDKTSNRDGSESDDGSSAIKAIKELHFDIRYYTPTVEVPLCGHATLASAAVIYQTVPMRTVSRSDTVLVFHAKQDKLTALLAPSSASGSSRGHHSSHQSSQIPPAMTVSMSSSQQQQQQQKPAVPRIWSTRITMQFPTKAVEELPDCYDEGDDDRNKVVKMIQSALAVEPDSILFVGISKELGDLFIEVTFESFLAIGYHGLNYDALLEYDVEHYTRGVIVCCRSNPPTTPVTSSNADGSGGGGGCDDIETASVASIASHLSSTGPVAPSSDFLSRFFAPKAGLLEDPVTGSAHCALAPYFSEKLGKDQVTGKQMSCRGGLVACRLVTGKDKKDEVRLTGTAQTAMSGTLWL